MFADMITESVVKYLMEAAMNINDIYEKYYNDIPQNYFTKIIQSDPTWNPQKQDKMGKYGKWLLSLYKNGNLKMEDLYKATEYLTYFNKYINKIEVKDINKYQTLPSLFSVVEAFIKADREGEEVATSKSDEIRKFKKDAKKVYEDSNWLILTPLTKEAAIYYGKNTEWCTAASQGENYFNYYNNQGPLYINIDKRNNTKYQFHFESGQYMDATDRSIGNPIAQTIGMSPQIVQRVYPSHSLILLESDEYIGLNNNVYIKGNDVVKTYNSGLFQDELGTQVQKIGELQHTRRLDSEDIKKLNNNIFVIDVYPREYNTLINTKDGTVTKVGEVLKDLRTYKREDGNLIFYGHYKDSLVVGRFDEDGKLQIIHNFRTSGWANVLHPNEEESEVLDGLNRYITINIGENDAYDTQQNAFNVFDLETLKIVLQDVVYDTTSHEDAQWSDDDGNGNVIEYIELRHVVTWDEVEQLYNETYGVEDEDDIDSEFDDDYRDQRMQEIAYEEAVYRATKWIVYQGGEIACVGY